MSVTEPDGGQPSGVAGETEPAESVEAARAQVDETREQLADTVEALAAKADVKGQAREKVAETKEQLAARGQGVKETVLEFGQKAQQATPDDAQRIASQAVDQARQRPVPVAAIVAFLVGFLLGRRSGSTER